MCGIKQATEKLTFELPSLLRWTNERCNESGLGSAGFT